MSDRYLYRAKRCDTGEWVIGYLSHSHCTGTEKGVESYYFNAIDKEGFCSQCIVFADKICQCTGREGEWEHDIFQCDDERYEIQFCEDSLTWEAVSIFSSESIGLGEFSPSEYVRIGNAIDNPELLEVGE